MGEGQVGRQPFQAGNDVTCEHYPTMNQSGCFVILMLIGNEPWRETFRGSLTPTHIWASSYHFVVLNVRLFRF